MRILVFMSDNRPLEECFEKAEYNSLVASINYEYCKKQKYDFLYYRPYLGSLDNKQLFNCKDPNTKVLRHSAWSKLLSASIAVEKDYSHIVYIDSDCIFKNQNRQIEQFIHMYADKDVLFLNNKPWNADKPCSGFFICKVCDQTKQFLKDWYSYNFGKKKNPCRFEQGALWFMHTNPTYKIGVIDRWMFQEKEGQFLRHVATHDASNRIPYFKKYIQANDINYLENIRNISCVEYNTTDVEPHTPSIYSQ